MAEKIITTTGSQNFYSPGGGERFVAYHGTKEQFDTIETPAWFGNSCLYVDRFSADNNGRTIIAFLVLKNPYITDNWSVTEPVSEIVLEDLQAKGYDGVISTDPENNQKIQYIVFSSDQIEQISSVF